MFRYNINALIRAGRDDPKHIVKLVRSILNPSKASTATKALIHRYKGFTGNGWILNPSVVFSKAKEEDIVEYLMLAGLRPYEDYVFYGVLTLPLKLAGGLVDEASSNPLLKLENDKIHFTYEDLMVQPIK